MRPVSFVTGLRDFGGRLAVVGPDGSELTYDELASRVDAMVDRLGTARRLVMIAAANDVDALVTYLGALAGGHPVLIAPARCPAVVEALTERYDPDVVVAHERGGWQFHERRAETVHDLHPDLSLLLCTSGSTGSPKLVRLSAESLEANAESIATYLDIRPTDRAVVSLPMSYCYGLSIVNSNLSRGAALLLTENSVVDPCFWARVHEYGATSIAGVPHTFDLLDTAGFASMQLPTLRYVTQAGGRLDPEKVKELASLGRRSGWDFFVMYGQTEATARMAFLPPDLAAENPSSIGLPVPGGEFEIHAEEGGTEGELVYRGPNVMLGYATERADLALGRTTDVLRTGDIARRNANGLYEIVGRKSRFIKLFGLRIDLDQVERVARSAGFDTVCTGSDGALVIAAKSEGEARAVKRLAAGRFGLPVSAVRACALPVIPRLDSGKPDYAAIRSAARQTDAAARPPAGDAAGRADDWVRRAFTEILDCAEVDDDATFVGLGGDSLSYVEMSTALESRLGRLPDGWHTMSVRDLQNLSPAKRALPRVETGVALRALAIILVVGSHIQLFHLLGGAHLLLVIAGWNFARFALAGGEAPHRMRRAVRTISRIAVPSVAWILYRTVSGENIGLANVLLINNYADRGNWGYWYIEALVQTLVVLALLFAVPAVRRLERSHSFAFAAAVLGVAVLARGLGNTFDDGNERVMTTHVVVWLFVLGWLAQRAATQVQRLTVVALVALLLPGFFLETSRLVIVAVGVLVLLYVRRVALPPLVDRVVSVIAGASLTIYLTHFAVYPPLLVHLDPALVTAVSLGVGVVAWLAARRLLRWATEVRSLSRRAYPALGPRRALAVSSAGGR